MYDVSMNVDMQHHIYVDYYRVDDNHVGVGLLTYVILIYVDCVVLMIIMYDVVVQLLVLQGGFVFI
jgi:hypothetical protein